MELQPASGHRIKRLTDRSTTNQSLASLLRRLNPVLRGWANFYRHCFGAHGVFSRLDWYIWDRIWRWQRKKHPRNGARKIYDQYCRRTANGRRKVWAEEGVELFFASTLTVNRYRLGDMSQPDFARTSGKPDA